MIYAKEENIPSINNYYKNQYRIIGIIDDNSDNWGKKINNFEIFSPDELRSICERKNIDLILIINDMNIVYKRNFVVAIS